MTFQPNSRVRVAVFVMQSISFLSVTGFRLVNDWRVQMRRLNTQKLPCCVLLFLSGRWARSKWPLSSFSPKHQSIEELVNDDRDRAF